MSGATRRREPLQGKLLKDRRGVALVLLLKRLVICAAVLLDQVLETPATGCRPRSRRRSTAAILLRRVVASVRPVPLRCERRAELYAASLHLARALRLPTLPARS